MNFYLTWARWRLPEELMGPTSTALLDKFWHKEKEESGKISPEKTPGETIYYLIKKHLVVFRVIQKRSEITVERRGPLQLSSLNVRQLFAAITQELDRLKSKNIKTITDRHTLKTTYYQINMKEVREILSHFMNTAALVNLPQINLWTIEVKIIWDATHVNDLKNFWITFDGM